MAGFGASGRNGGWCSALFAASDAASPGTTASDAGAAMRRAMQATVDEVGRDGGATRGSTAASPRAARSWPPATGRRSTGPTAEVAEARAPRRRRGGPALARRGRGERAARQRRVSSAPPTPRTAPRSTRPGWPGAWPTPSSGAACAIYEHTGRSSIVPGGPGRRPPVGADARGHGDAPTSSSGRSRAGRRRCPATSGALVPVYSLMIATEPLADAFWDRAGLAERETFADHRHLIIYGQRTADGRLAFGGRGAAVPLRLARSGRPSTGTPTVHRALRRALVELFPALAGVSRHPPLGRPARRAPRLVLLGRPRPVDRPGVGRRLRRRRGVDRQPGRPDPGRPHPRRTTATWPTCPGSATARRRWEPEPLRWLGVNAGLRAVEAADRTEARHGHPSRLATAVGRLLGG